MTQKATGSRLQAQGADPDAICVHPRASAADRCMDFVEDLRTLCMRLSTLRREDDWLRWLDYSRDQLQQIAVNIATRTVRDDIRELEIRRSRNLPPVDVSRPGAKA